VNRVLTFLAVALVMAAMMVVMSAPAFAKITPAQPPSCENAGGNEPGGQQPTCQGEGLTQNQATPATNPSGNEPPGQQP
jgi:Spy/CpxP family protein refolding chaperone